MSTKIDVLVRAIQDSRFRDLLFENPDQALEGFDLSRLDERVVRGLDRGEYDEAVRQIERDLYSRIERGEIGDPSVSINAGVWPVVEEIRR